MKFLEILYGKYSSFQVFFKSFFLLVILFLVFFAVNLFINIKNKSQSAYTALNKDATRPKAKLQDTRVHNWSEIEKKTKNLKVKTQN